MSIIYNEALVRRIVHSIFQHLITIDMSSAPESAHSGIQLTGLGSAMVLFARQLGLNKELFLEKLRQEWDAIDRMEARDIAAVIPKPSKETN